MCGKTTVNKMCTFCHWISSLFDNDCKDIWPWLVGGVIDGDEKEGIESVFWLVEDVVGKFVVGNGGIFELCKDENDGMHWDILSNGDEADGA